MQSSKEQKLNTAKERFFIIFKARKPSASLNDVFSARSCGGVFGRVKAYRLKMKDAEAAI